MMRKSLTPAIVLLCVAALTLTGCASKKYVNEQIASSDEMTATKIGEVQTSVEGNQKAISDLQAKDKQLEDQIAKLSDTAKDALARANEAGKLAEGRFVDEIVLTDDNVTFGFDKASLTDDAKATLEKFVKGLKSKNTNMFIEIQGHTDSTGSEQHNLKLGYKRAETVMQFLNRDMGVSLHRMNVISYGEFKPIADNNTREGRAKNRRVSLVVMK